MKPAIQAVVGVILVAFLVLGTLFMVPFGQNAYADSHEAGVPPTNSAPPAPVIGSCSVVKQAGVNIQFQCVDTLGNIIPAGQIVVEPQVIISEIAVPVPGPTVTVTDKVRVPVPGPVRTQTVRPAPVRITTTQTVRPEPVRITATVRPAPVVRTKTVTPEPVVVTETIVNEVTRQPDPVPATVEPSNPNKPFFTPSIDFGDGDVTVGEAGISLLGALLILACIFGGMIYGFRQGQKNEESSEAFFLRALLDRNKTG